MAYRDAQYERRHSAGEELRNLRIATRVARKAQEDAQRAAELVALKEQRNALIQRGVPPTSLPRIVPGMSERDLVAAATRLRAVGGPRGTMMRLNGTPAADQSMLGATMEQKRAAVGLPARPTGLPVAPDPIDPMNPRGVSPLTKDIVAAAGTGRVINTPYDTPGGGIKSTTADWQKELAAKHPELGVAGSPMNATFLKQLAAAKLFPKNQGRSEADIAGEVAGRIASDPLANYDAPPPIERVDPATMGRPSGVAASAGIGRPLSGAERAGQQLRSDIGAAAGRLPGMLKPLLPFAAAHAGSILAPVGGGMAGYFGGPALAAGARKVGEMAGQVAPGIASAVRDAGDFINGALPSRQLKSPTAAGFTQIAGVKPFQWDTPAITPLGNETTNQDVLSNFMRMGANANMKKNLEDPMQWPFEE